MVAHRIREERNFGTKQSYMGAVITRLIRRMGLLRTADVSRFTTEPGWSAQPLDFEFLARIEVLKIERDGSVLWPKRECDPTDVDRVVERLTLPRGVKKRKPAAVIRNDSSGEDVM